MAAIEITRELTATLLEEMVAEAGEDFVYAKRQTNTGAPACRYVWQGEPDCGVGKFLHTLGVPLTELEDADKYNFGGGQPARSLLDRLEQEGVITIDWVSKRALAEFQYSQDMGSAWGTALRHALNEL